MKDDEENTLTAEEILSILRDIEDTVTAQGIAKHLPEDVELGREGISKTLDRATSALFNHLRERFGEKLEEKRRRAQQ